MIWGSMYWKQPLLEMADCLEHLKTACVLFEEELAQVEATFLLASTPSGSS